MPIQVNLKDVRHAWEARDPQLPDLIVRISKQTDPAQTISSEDVPNFDAFLSTIRTQRFQKKTKEEKALFRMAWLKDLDAENRSPLLPDRLRLHEMIWALWQDKSPFARRCLLSVIGEIRLNYGPWRALKRIYKEAEACNDIQVIGALAARFDMALSNQQHDVGQKTMGYMCRRAWRYLRRTAEGLPLFYADAASEYLVAYTENTNWNHTWIANHLFFHASKKYQRKKFYYYCPSNISLIKQRAYPELWQRTPRPLFSLLERAGCEQVRRFAVEALQKDFRANLRDIEASWVSRLIRVGSAVIDEFVVWLFDHSSRLEQAAFRELGLHRPVLSLFESTSDKARVYAANYARTYARDMTVEEMIRLLHNSHEAVRRLVFDLLAGLDPRKDVGLDNWGLILENRHGYDYAARMLRKHFGPHDLTPQWFQARLTSSNHMTAAFAQELLPRVHSFKKLGTTFFISLLESIITDDTFRSIGGTRKVVHFALDQLSRFDLNGLDPDILKQLFLHPLTWRQMANWFEQGRLDPKTLPTDFYKHLAYHPQWETDPFIVELKNSSPVWMEALHFNEALSEEVFLWFRDLRRFAPKDIGFDWLLTLAARSEMNYHSFAAELLIKAFAPADFADKDYSESSGKKRGGGAVDLKGAGFLFTGKMATMNRKDAQIRVKQSNGIVASGVNRKLTYLVIGDDGSPLYGNGRKGSKQVKAEGINAKGGDIHIISETTFMEMLSGRTIKDSPERVRQGCLRLWEMAVGEGKEDSPLRKFAVTYLQQRHRDIGPAQTDRPVEPGKEVPSEFLSFERIKPLFSDGRKLLRDLALTFSQWEFARWAPPADTLIELCELPDTRIRKFVSRALLADDIPSNRPFRLEAASFSPEEIFAFCESTDAATRELGMTLVRMNPRFQLPDELFRLTESPDRRLRAFVIHTLWALYRRFGTTSRRSPYMSGDTSTVDGQAVPLAGKALPPPAGPEELYNFLRRILFEIPPARHEKRKEAFGSARLKPLPARKAKLAMVEVMRDMAVDNHQFARIILPLLEEFMQSKGRSEMAACLVAVTRIKAALGCLS